MEFILFILVILVAMIFGNRRRRWSDIKIDYRNLFNAGTSNRREYYRNVYLKSDAWKRKRFVVLRRDNWKCVYCGGRATQVHHKRYARKNIGKEPIDWLVSICASCHDSVHRRCRPF